MLLALVPVEGCAAVASPPVALGDAGVGGVAREAGAGWDAAGSGSVTSAGPDASSCRAGDVETYVPVRYKPATAAWQGVCTSDQISGYYDACLGSLSSPGYCATFAQQNPTCAACIVTPDTADHYGPIVSHDSFVTRNVAGCIELTDPGALTCAKAIQALSGCELAACEANCPVSDAPSLAAYQTCAAQADRTGCQAYNGAAGCIADTESPSSGSGDTSLSGLCSNNSTKQFYESVVPLFCGAGSAHYDAGVATAFDAGSD